jgi:hypothetical protein
VGYVVSRPDKNRIGLRCRRQQLRLSTACPEENCVLVSSSVSWCEVKLRQNHWRLRNAEDDESQKKEETLHGDEHKELQRIAEVIVKERIIIIFNYGEWCQ